jgi:hypothetical protein
LGFGFWGGFFLLEPVQELAHDAARALGLGELGLGGEEALFGVGGDLFYGLRGFFAGIARRLGGLAGEVVAGYLEAVEEETGSLGVDLIVGDAEEDLADGELDGGAVFGHGEVEGVAVFAGARVRDRAAGGVVVAKVFLAQAWAAAAVAVGEDVAALVAFWLGHLGTPPWCTFGLKVFERCGLGMDSGFWVKCEEPRLRRGSLFVSSLICSGWRVINRQRGCDL